MTRFIDGLAELAPAYRVLFCDVWGVLHDGIGAFGPACDALARWRREVGPVVLVSNSPRPSGPVARQLASVGVPHRAWSALATSGDATRALLSQRAPGPAWRIGPARDGALYRGLGLRFSSLEEAAFIACTGLEDDEAESPDDYRDRLARAARRGLEMVCANPDVMVQRGDRLVYCGGALAQLYQSLGGAVLMAGKPFLPIYELALRAAARDLGAEPAPAEVLAIGDGLNTDLPGARAFGLDALFIATGMHGAAALDAAGRLRHDKVEAMLHRAGERAAFAMADLSW